MLLKIKALKTTREIKKIYILMVYVEVSKEIVKLGALLKGSEVSSLLNHWRDSWLCVKNIGTGIETLLSASACPNCGPCLTFLALGMSVSGFVFNTLRG